MELTKENLKAIYRRRSKKTAHVEVTLDTEDGGQGEIL